MFVGSKAPWYEILDDLPQHDESRGLDRLITLDRRMTGPVPEAQLTKTELGLVVESEGWFVLNARDATWIRSDDRGQDTDFEGKQEFPQLGFRIQVLGPGQHGLYHGERGQEDFLVVSGECLLVIEGEERRLEEVGLRPLPALDTAHLHRCR